MDRSANDDISNNNKNIKEAGRNLKWKVVMALYNYKGSKVGDMTFNRVSLTIKGGSTDSWDSC